MILVLDNRDSFTFNLVQVLMELGAEARLLRAADVHWRSVLLAGAAGLVIGPGPGTPDRAGCSEEVVRRLSADLPTLGVCLGLQAMATAFGGSLRRSGELVHGQTRTIDHDGRGFLRGIPSPVPFARYNSLAVDEGTLPGELLVTARDSGGEIMGLRHRTRPLEGVQFHPESILCVDEAGRRLFTNFLEDCAAVHPIPARAPSSDDAPRRPAFEAPGA